MQARREAERLAAQRLAEEHRLQLAEHYARQRATRQG